MPSSRDFIDSIGRKAFKVVFDIDSQDGAFLEYECDTEDCTFYVSFDFLLVYKCQDLIDFKQSNGVSPLKVLNNTKAQFTIESMSLADSSVILETVQTGRDWLNDQNPFYQFDINKTPSGVVFDGIDDVCCIVKEDINNELQNENCALITDDTFSAKWNTYKFQINPNIYSCSTDTVKKKIKIGLLFKDLYDVDFNIMMDNIKITKQCKKEYLKPVIFTQSPGFELKRVCDNKKSWVEIPEDDKTERTHDLKYRGTRYTIDNSRRIVNSKEIDAQNDPASAIECDVFKFYDDGCYADNNPNITNFYVFYDFTSIPSDIAITASGTINNWFNQLKDPNSDRYIKNYVGNLYELTSSSERWVSWLSVPYAGVVANQINGPVSPSNGVFLDNTSGYGFEKYPLDITQPGSPISGTFTFPGGDKNAVVIIIGDEFAPLYHSETNVSDYFAGQPTNIYTQDYENFILTFLNYEKFSAFTYPVNSGIGYPTPSSDTAREIAVVQTYAAVEGELVDTQDLIENPRTLMQGRNHSVLTYRNPYQDLAGNSIFLTLPFNQRVKGPGLKNFNVQGRYDRYQASDFEAVNGFNSVFISDLDQFVNNNQNVNLNNNSITCSSNNIFGF